MLGAMLQMDLDSPPPQGEGGAPIEPGVATQRALEAYQDAARV